MTFDEWFDHKVETKIFNDSAQMRYIAEAAYEAGARGIAWHYTKDKDFPQCDENTQLVFYVKDWNVIRNDYYYHFALGFYRPPFVIDGGKVFVEESKGYSCEHSPKYVIMWKELVPPEMK